MGEKFTVRQLVLRGITAESRYDVLDQVSNWLLEKEIVHNSFREAVKLREEQYPTGLPTLTFGVAIPHVDVCHVRENAILVVPLKKPVRFQMMGSWEHEEVEVECLFVILLSEVGKQLEILKQLMRLIQSKGDMQRIQSAGDDESIFAVLEEYLSSQNERGRS